MWTTARTAGVERLFKYQKFNPDRLSDLIVHKRLWFSDPMTFNDPWDCKPFYYVGDFTNSDVIERHVQWYLQVTRRHQSNLAESEIQKRAEYFRANPKELGKKTLEVA